jgi:hypothetical protein
MVLDRMKAELYLFGRRHAAIDPQSLCSHLDLLVGTVVGEVMINNLETKLGREDGEWMRKTHPNASTRELVDMLIEGDLVSGMGITKVVLGDDLKDRIRIEIWNPVVKGEKGAAKSFLFSWWCGALMSILGRDLEIKTVQYDEHANTIRCEITPRQIV